MSGPIYKPKFNLNLDCKDHVSWSEATLKLLKDLGEKIEKAPIHQAPIHQVEYVDYSHGYRAGQIYANSEVAEDLLSDLLSETKKAIVKGPEPENGNRLYGYDWSDAALYDTRTDSPPEPEAPLTSNRVFSFEFDPEK